MPSGPVPDRYRGIVESTTLRHLTTVDPHGRPQRLVRSGRRSRRPAPDTNLAPL